MAALTAPYDARRKADDVVAYPLAANTQVFKGGLAALNGGYAQPAADAAGVPFAGVFLASVNNQNGATQPGQITPSLGSPAPNLPSGLTVGTAAALSVRVSKTGCFVFGKAAAVPSDVGKQAFVVDDNTVSTAATAHNVPCGYVTEWVDASHVRVRIDLAVN